MTKEFVGKETGEDQGASRGERGLRNQRNVEARTVGMTASGADRVVAYEVKARCPRLEGHVPWFLAIEVV